MKYKLVYIEWQDAHSFDEGWTSEARMAEYAKSNEFIVKDVGWIYKETKSYILLMSQWVSEGEFLAEGFSHIIKIPKGWIRKRKVLKI